MNNIIKESKNENTFVLEDHLDESINTILKNFSKLQCGHNKHSPSKLMLKIIFQELKLLGEKQAHDFIKSHGLVTKKDLINTKEHIMNKIVEFAEREKVLFDKINADIDALKKGSFISAEDQAALDQVEQATSEIAERINSLIDSTGSVKGHFVGTFTGVISNNVDNSVTNVTNNEIDGNLNGRMVGSAVTGSLSGSYSGSYAGVAILNGTTTTVSGSLDGLVNGVFISIA